MWVWRAGGSRDRLGRVRLKRWGVATVVNGQVAGVAGHFRSRRRAQRKARANASVLDLTDAEVEGYRVVARSSRASDDWGVRPGAIVTESVTESVTET